MVVPPGTLRYVQQLVRRHACNSVQSNHVKEPVCSCLKKTMHEQLNIANTHRPSSRRGARARRRGAWRGRRRGTGQ
jgi:hypothetical protein